METKYKRLCLACYSSSLSCSVIAYLSPLLFLTFNKLYGISFSLLGLLILINYSTQLLVDLIFSFWSHKFNIQKTVKFMPWLTVAGLFIYAVLPILFPKYIYAGLAIGTVVFSSAGGLGEVLISPVIAKIPSDNPERQMSRLHSIYAWGVVFVVIFSTLFLEAFGRESWQWLALLFMTIPLYSAFMYLHTDVPDIETPQKTSGAVSLLKNKGLWICVIAIFLGGAAECTMAQWSSGYLEQAFNIPKLWGDIFGVALFSVMLGLGRTLYGKYGNNIGKVLFLCALGSTICYLVSALSITPLVGLISCVLTGFCTCMLWPGTLSVASERFPEGGVFVFALMAAGGDLGASVVSQFVGVVADMAMINPGLITMAESLSISPEQFGMKLGMLIGMIFPLIATFLFYRIWKNKQ